jgi:UvrD-like helicase C-terminal domain/AAA domain
VTHNLTNKQMKKLTSSAMALVASANEGHDAYRQVTPRAARTIVERSLNKSRKLPFSVREYLAVRDLSDFISVLQKDKTNLDKVRNADLLPVGHPSSKRPHAMTASALRAERGRWYACDPRITNDEARTIIASAFSAPEFSPEETYYLTRLLALPQGSAPLSALLASYGGGNSRAARSARARMQRRDRKGRFAWQGGGMSALVRRRDGSTRRLTGRTVAQGVGNDDTFDFETPDGKIYRVPASSAESSKGYLELDEYPDGYSPAAAKISGDDVVIPEESLVTVEAPNGFRRDESYDGPGTRYTDDAYTVTKLDPNNPDHEDSIPGDFWSRDVSGKMRIDDKKPVYLVTRDDDSPIAENIPLQNWGDVQDAIRADEPVRDREEGREPDPIATLNEEQLNRLYDEVGDRDPYEAINDILGKTAQPKAEETAFEFDDPTGADLVDDSDQYEPVGRTSQDSEDYTDDPAILAQRYSEDEIRDALEEAVTPGLDRNPPGDGELEFEAGPERVPAQALYETLKEQGADARGTLQSIYDKIGGKEKQEPKADLAPKPEVTEDSIRERAAQWEGRRNFGPEYNRAVSENLGRIDRALEKGDLEDASRWMDDIDKYAEKNKISPLPLEEAPGSAPEAAKLPELFDGLSEDEKARILETGDYADYLPQNDEFDVPEGYNALDSDPFENFEEVEDFDPINLANNFDSLDLSESFAEGLRPDAARPGYGTVGRVDEDGEESFVTAPLEAIRDALQMQGVDTNELTRNVYDEASRKEEEAPTPEPTPEPEPEAELPSDEDLVDFEEEPSDVEIVENEDGTVSASTTASDGDDYTIFTRKNDDGSVDLVIADSKGNQAVESSAPESDLDDLNDQAAAYADEIAQDSEIGRGIVESVTGEPMPEREAEPEPTPEPEAELEPAPEVAPEPEPAPEVSKTENEDGSISYTAKDSEGGDHTGTSYPNPDGTSNIVYTDPDGNQTFIAENIPSWEAPFIAERTASKSAEGQEITPRGMEPVSIEDVGSGFYSKRDGAYFTEDYVKHLLTADPESMTLQEFEDYLDLERQLPKEERKALKQRSKAVGRVGLRNSVGGRGFPSKSKFKGERTVAKDDESGEDETVPGVQEGGKKPQPVPGEVSPDGEGRTVPDPANNKPSRPDIPEQDFFYVDPGGKKTKVKFTKEYVKHLFSSSPKDLTNQELADLMTMISQLPGEGDDRYKKLKSKVISEYVARTNGTKEPVTRYPGDRYLVENPEDAPSIPSSDTPSDTAIPKEPTPSPKPVPAGSSNPTRKSELNRRSRDLLAQLDDTLRRLLDQGMPDNFYPNLPQAQREAKFRELLADLEATLEESRTALRDFIRTKEDSDDNREALERLAELIDRGRRQLSRLERGGFTGAPAEGRDPSLVQAEKSLNDLSDWIEDALDPDWTPGGVAPSASEPGPAPKPRRPRKPRGPRKPREPEDEAPTPEPTPEPGQPTGPKVPTRVVEISGSTDPDGSHVWTFVDSRGRTIKVVAKKNQFTGMYTLQYHEPQEDGTTLVFDVLTSERFSESWDAKSTAQELASWLASGKDWRDFERPRFGSPSDRSFETRPLYRDSDYKDLDVESMDIDEMGQKFSQRLKSMYNDVSFRQFDSHLRALDLDPEDDEIFAYFENNLFDSSVDEASMSLDIVNDALTQLDENRAAITPESGDLRNAEYLKSLIKRLVVLSKKPTLTREEREEMANIANSIHPVFYGSNANPDEYINGNNFLERAFEGPKLKRLLEQHMSNKGVETDSNRPTAPYRPKPTPPGPKVEKTEKPEPAEKTEGEEAPAAKKGRKRGPTDKPKRGLSDRIRRVFDYTEKVKNGEVSLRPKKNLPEGTSLPEDNYDYADEAFPPTEEQRNIITAIMSGADTVARALAGTGKTSTLKAAARRILKEDPDRNILYVAFNKSTQVEASETMPENTHPLTADSISYQAAVSSEGSDDDYSFMPKRMNAVGQEDEEEIEDEEGNKRVVKTPKVLTRVLDIVDHFGVQNGQDSEGNEIGASEIVGAALRAVQKFTVSDDDEISEKHFKEIGIENPSPDLINLAKTMWADKTSSDGKLSITNNDITKKWALTRPDLSQGGREFPPLDLIFFDEAQDMNPVLSKVIRDQNIQVVYVGDSNQAIYGFRGAVDELNNVETTFDLPLTQSWRFGPQVASVANRFLFLLGSKYRVRGGGPEAEILSPGEMTEPDAILSRTVLGSLTAALDELSKGRRVATGKAMRKDIIDLVDSVRALRMGQPGKVRHPDVAKYSSWDEMRSDFSEGKMEGRLNQLFGLLSTKEGEEQLLKLASEIKFNFLQGFTADRYVPEIKPEDVEDKSVFDIFFEHRPFRVGDKRKQSPRPAQATVVRNPDGFVSVYVFGQVLQVKKRELTFDLSARGFKFDKDGSSEEATGVPSMQSGKNKGSNRAAFVATFETEEDAFNALNGLRQSWQGVMPEETDVYVSTAHVAKGLEYDKVMIDADFEKKGPQVNESGEVVMPSDEELRLAYVAVTRAKRQLDPGGLSWIFDKVSEDQANADPDLDPVTQDSPLGDDVISPEFKTVLNTSFNNPDFYNNPGPDEAIRMLRQQRNFPGANIEELDSVVDSIKRSASPPKKPSAAKRAEEDFELLQRLDLDVPPDDRVETSFDELKAALESPDSYQNVIDTILDELGGKPVGNGVWRLWKTVISEEGGKNARRFEIVVQRNEDDSFSVLHRVVQLTDAEGNKLDRPKIIATINSEKFAHSAVALKGIANKLVNEVVAARFNPVTRRDIVDVFRNKARVNKVLKPYNPSGMRRVSADNVTQLNEGDRVWNHVVGQYGYVVGLVPSHEAGKYDYRDYVYFVPDGSTSPTRMPAKNLLKVDPDTGNWIADAEISQSDIPKFWKGNRQTEIVPPTNGYDDPPMSTKRRRELREAGLNPDEIESIEREERRREREQGQGDSSGLEGSNETSDSDSDIDDDSALDFLSGEDDDLGGVVPGNELPDNWTHISEDEHQKAIEDAYRNLAVRKLITRAKRNDPTLVSRISRALKVAYPQASDKEIEELMDVELEKALESRIAQAVRDSIGSLHPVKPVIMLRNSRGNTVAVTDPNATPEQIRGALEAIDDIESRVFIPGMNYFISDEELFTRGGSYSKKDVALTFGLTVQSDHFMLLKPSFMTTDKTHIEQVARADIAYRIKYDGLNVQEGTQEFDDLLDKLMARYEKTFAGRIDRSAAEALISHEMGHAVDNSSEKLRGYLPRSDGKSTSYAEYRKLSKSGADALEKWSKSSESSDYSRSAPAEAYAEAFSEWYLARGKPDNPLVAEIARGFGWDKRFPNVLISDTPGDIDLPETLPMSLVPVSSGKRIYPHSGTRKDTKNNERANQKLISEATTVSELPEDVRAKIQSGMDTLGVTPEQLENNILAVYNRAVAAYGENPEGIDWYSEAKEIANNLGEYGLEGDQAAALIAAISPQQSWSDNIAAAQYMARSLSEDHEVQVDTLLQTTFTKKIDKKSVSLSAYEWAKREVQGGDGTRSMDGEIHAMPSPEELRGKKLSDLDPYVAAAIMKAHAQVGYRTGGIGATENDGDPLTSRDDVSGDITNVRFTSGVHHMGRGVRIARGEDPNEILNGHKVRSFYNNITGEWEDVTVDSHAFSAAMGVKYGSGSDEYGFFAGSGKYNGLTSPRSATYGVLGLYAPFADAYRRVAASLGITPAQLQAIVWNQWRKENPSTTRKPTAGEIAEIVQDLV